MRDGVLIFVHQINPEVIDIEKVRQYHEEGRDHELVFPEQLKSDANEEWIMVPVEVSMFDRGRYDRFKKYGDDLDPFSHNYMDGLPPRFVMINTNWTLEELHE